MSSGLGEPRQTITYLRERNIHAVQTFLGDRNGTDFRYNKKDNEYYLNGHRCEVGDIIEKNIYGNYMLIKREKPACFGDIEAGYECGFKQVHPHGQQCDCDHE